MRYSLILLVAAMLLSLGIRYFADPVHLFSASTNPAHDLNELVSHESDLGPALIQADQGNIAGLSSWINRSDPLMRERLATLLLGMLHSPTYKDDFDPDLCWRYRNRFRAFLDLSTGNERIDTIIDNLVAYTLITGTAAPSTQDINLAKALLPRLRRAAKEVNDNGIWDTIGCVEFASEDFAAAKEAFKQAMRYLADTHEPSRHRVERLEQKRYDATVQNEKVIAERQHPGDSATPGDLVPLPREEAVTEEAKKP